MLKFLLCIGLALPALCWASDDASRFQAQVSELVALRSQAYQFAVDHQISQQSKPKLSRADSNQMRDIALRYIALRGQLLPYAETMAPLFESKLKISTQHATNAHLSHSNLARNFATLWINPNDAAGKKLLLDIQRGLASALVLMDSYQIAIEPYANNPSLAYVLTYDVDSKTNLRQLASNYHSPSFRTKLALATRFVDELMAWRRKNAVASSEDENYYYALTQSTVWYVALRKGNSIDVANTLQYMVKDLGLHEQSLQNTLSYGISMGFGNMVGLVQTRQGKLNNFSDSEIQQLAGKLKPLDILLEKTPFRLSDKMIPGHYGHVAVWLGSEAELRQIGVWDQIAPAYQTKIRNGARIVEALRTGVTISSLKNFLNIDDLLVLRERKTLSVAQQKAAVITALEQIGKEYDFNFDVQTHERIVCSELAYVVFPDTPWPLAQTLGRYTISPDNVAQLAVSESPLLDPVLIYRDGTPVKDNLREVLAKLINPKTAVLAKK